jgi:YggT family protein
VDTLVRYIDSFFLVYTMCILVRILMSWVTIVPMRRWSQAVVQFFHDTTDWYLGFWRRLIPPVGPLDLSPIVALIVLVIVNQFVVRIVNSL